MFIKILIKDSEYNRNIDAISRFRKEFNHNEKRLVIITEIS